MHHNKIPDGDTGQQSRRKFLSMAGMAGLATAGLASCKKVPDWVYVPGKGGHNGETVDLGSGDIGILNYAYALEQLEAAFYTLVASDPFAGCTSYERQLLQDIRDHEIAHREFFKKALGDKAIPTLKLDFSSVNFVSRDSVLATAKAFEDLGVSAYNGAGSLIANADYLLIAGKIVSVEARHAAYIRDLISYGSFADSTVVDSNGLDKSRKPSEVLPIAGNYIKTKLDASHLPS